LLKLLSLYALRYFIVELVTIFSYQLDILRGLFFIFSALHRYRCHCGRDYGSKQALRKHQRDHSGIYPFTCKTCNKGFSVRSRLLEHEMKHEDKPVGICCICGFEAKSFAGLRTHKNIHLKNSYDCSVCDKKFYSKQGLTRHEILHKGGHVCVTCTKIFPSDEKLQKHLQSDAHKERTQIDEMFIKL
jgi:KRAB domain-containing zinc finger protein